ncbi:MAG: hypothetical protein D6B25_12090 [Desulfobulbaceae bacterium]|nr:MAG: hypothetical protein D6B25_12090 [Desulfobulbaceae bacterium]
MVDAGNILNEKTNTTNREQALRKTIAISEAYKLMGYDAIGVGPYDLLSEESIIEQLKATKLPLISCNFYHQSGDLVFEPYKSYQMAGLDVAIIGITGTTSLQTSDFYITEGITELSQNVKSLRPTHDIIILLSTLRQARVVEVITNQIEGIDIVIGGDSRHGSINSLQFSDSLITQTAELGKSLGILEITWRGKPWKVDYQKQISRLKRSLNRVNRLLMKNKSSKSSAQKSDEKQKQLLDRKNQLITLIEETEKKKDNTQQRTDRSTFRSRSMVLDSRMVEDQEMRKLLQTAGF